MESDGLWIDFPFSKAYRDSIEPGDGSFEASETTTQEKILALLREDPELTGKALADHTGITAAGIRYHLANLRKAGRIRHVGPTKKGALGDYG